MLSAYTADILGRCYAIIERQRMQPNGLVVKLAGPVTKVATIIIKQLSSRSRMHLWRSAAGRRRDRGDRGAGTTQFSVMVLFFLISGVNLHKLCSSHISLLLAHMLRFSGPADAASPGHVWGTAVFAILRKSSSSWSLLCCMPRA